MSDKQVPTIGQYLQVASNLVSTAAAVLALVYSVNTYRDTERSDRQSRAREEWSNFLTMSTEHSDIPDISGIVIGDQIKGDQIKDVRYRWYLDRMFFYFDNILLSDQDEKWRILIRKELDRNDRVICVGQLFGTLDLTPEGTAPESAAVIADRKREYLRSEFKPYSREFRDLVSTVLADCESRLKRGY